MLSYWSSCVGLTFEGSEVGMLSPWTGEVDTPSPIPFLLLALPLRRYLFLLSWTDLFPHRIPVLLLIS